MEQKYSAVKSTTFDNQKILEFNSLSTGLTSDATGNTVIDTTLTINPSIKDEYGADMGIQFGPIINDTVTQNGLGIVLRGHRQKTGSATLTTGSKFETQYWDTVNTTWKPGFSMWNERNAGSNSNTFTLQVGPSDQTSYSYYFDHSGTSTAAVWATSSDDRLKHNEEDITNGLEIIKKLSPQVYDKTVKMLDEDYNGPIDFEVHSREAGFIAQEVYQIPELQFIVNEPHDENSTYSINYTNLHAYSIAAIKELDDKISNISSTSDSTDNSHSLVIESMKNEIDQLTVDLDSAQTELDVQKNSIIDTQTELDTANSTIELLSSKLQQVIEKNNDLELRIESLENP